MLGTQINGQPSQAVLTADKKMFIDRNKEDTIIEQRYLLPSVAPKKKRCLAPSLVDFIPRGWAMRERTRSFS